MVIRLAMLAAALLAADAAPGGDRTGADRPADGPPGIHRPDAREAANRAVALGYIDMVWVQHRPVEGFARYVDPQSVHYPGRPGGSDPEGLARFLKAYPQFRYHVKQVFTDGDYVIVHSLLTGVPGTGQMVKGPQPGAAEKPKVGDEVVDIYRISNGRIVQHWDTVEAIGGDAESVFSSASGQSLGQSSGQLSGKSE